MVDGVTVDGLMAQRHDGSSPQWLNSCLLDSSTTRQLMAQRLNGWHGGSIAERLDSSTLVGAMAQQLDGSTALWLDGSLDGLATQWLSGPTAWRLDGSMV